MRFLGAFSFQRQGEDFKVTFTETVCLLRMALGWSGWGGHRESPLASLALPLWKTAHRRTPTSVSAPTPPQAFYEVLLILNHKF